MKNFCQKISCKVDLPTSCHAVGFFNLNVGTLIAYKSRVLKLGGAPPSEASKVHKMVRASGFN